MDKSMALRCYGETGNKYIGRDGCSFPYVKGRELEKEIKLNRDRVKVFGGTLSLPMVK